MALSILLVDPNQEWLDRAAEYFKAQDYSIEMCTHGQGAQLTLYKNEFFAVVLNLEVKNHTGMEVLRYIRSIHPTLTVILTMNRPDFLEVNEINRELLAKQGIRDIFVHPFPFEELLDAVEGHLDYGQILNKAPVRKEVSAVEEEMAQDEQFTAIRVEEFLVTKSVQFDLYIRLGAGRYLKILHAGDAFSSDRVKKYKEEKKVENLYFKTEDRRKFIRLGNYVVSRAARSEKVSSEAKITMLRNVAHKWAEETYCEGVRPRILDQGKSLCDNLFEVVHNSDGLAKLLREYSDFDPSAFNHSYLVSLFCGMMVKQFEWESKTLNEALGLAALFHDIGFMKLPPELSKMRPEDMTSEQLELYRTHPELGVEILAQNKFVSPTVKQIVMQHHEWNDGKGFPTGMGGGRLLNLSKILALINDFCNMISTNKLPPPKALKFMLSDQNTTNRYSSPILEKLIHIFVDEDKLKLMKKRGEIR